MSFFDCVFLHRDVLETVTSLGSPRRPLPQHPKALFFLVVLGWFLLSATPVHLALRLECSRTRHRRAGPQPHRHPAGDPAASRPRWTGPALDRTRAGGGDGDGDAAGGCGRTGEDERTGSRTGGTDGLRNWSPRFVYPLYISQT